MDTDIAVIVLLAIIAICQIAQMDRHALARLVFYTVITALIAIFINFHLSGTF